MEGTPGVTAKRLLTAKQQAAAESRATKMRLRPTDIEWKLAAAFDRAGVPYVSQYPVDGYFADFYLPCWRVLVECDGWHHRVRYYSWREKYRDWYLASQGWVVLRYTDEHIRRNADAVVSRILVRIGVYR